MDKSKPQVSIVIAAYNEEKYLPSTLESIAKLKTDQGFEVIVVDNNSTDKTARVAEDYKTRLNLRVVSEKKEGRGAARFRGFEVALGKIIISTDADAMVYPDWLKTMTKDISGEVVATTSSCRIEDGSFLTKTLFNFIQPQAMILYRLVFGHFWFCGFSFAILKSVYQKAGRFNPGLQAQEDLDLSFRVAKLGKIKFINKPVTVSARRFKQEGLLLGLYDYIRSFSQAFVFKKKSVYLDNPR